MLKHISSLPCSVVTTSDMGNHLMIAPGQKYNVGQFGHLLMNSRHIFRLVLLLELWIKIYSILFFNANYSPTNIIVFLSFYSLSNSLIWCVYSKNGQAVVTMYNFQQYRHIQAPGWTLGWTWAKKEVIWSMMGAQTTEQGDCSRYKGNTPHCCKKNPTVVDLLPGTPYNQQIANCCKGGVINSWVQDPSNFASSFQVSVGAAGTTNKTVRVPKNFTLKAPGPGYTCGPAKVGKPTKFVSQDGRRQTQAMSKLFSTNLETLFV